MRQKKKKILGRIVRKGVYLSCQWSFSSLRPKPQAFKARQQQSYLHFSQWVTAWSSGRLMGVFVISLMAHYINTAHWLENPGNHNFKNTICYVLYVLECLISTRQAALIRSALWFPPSRTLWRNHRIGQWEWNLLLKINKYHRIDCWLKSWGGGRDVYLGRTQGGP